MLAYQYAPLREVFQGQNHRGTVYPHGFCQNALRWQALPAVQVALLHGLFNKPNNPLVQGQMGQFLFCNIPHGQLPRCC